MIQCTGAIYTVKTGRHKCHGLMPMGGQRPPFPGAEGRSNDYASKVTFPAMSNS